MEALIPFPPHPIILGSLCVGDGGGGEGLLWGWRPLILTPPPHTPPPQPHN